jgi:hypothetical protein
MPDVYYHCHNCGSLHEAEAIRLNLHLAGNPVGDPWFPRRSLLGWLEHRRLTALLMRGLWPAGAARNDDQRWEATCRSMLTLDTPDHTSRENSRGGG